MQRKRSASAAVASRPDWLRFFVQGKEVSLQQLHMALQKQSALTGLLLLFEAGNYKHGREKQSRPFFQDQ